MGSKIWYGIAVGLNTLAYCLVRFFLFFYYRITIEGRAHLPKKTGAIYASNHRSFLDPVLVAIAEPRFIKGGSHPFNYMAKEYLFQVPVFGRFIRLLGAFPLSEPKDPSYQVMNEATRRLHRGRNLTIFPEGTRHTDGKVGRGKSGMCVLAAQSGKPVIPIGLVFDSNNLHFRSRICIRIGTPLYAANYGLDATSTPHDMHAMRQDIMAQIRELVEENPPFPIEHDTPKKRTTIEIEAERRKAARLAPKNEAPEQTEE